MTLYILASLVVLWSACAFAWCMRTLPKPAKRCPPAEPHPVVVLTRHGDTWR